MEQLRFQHPDLYSLCCPYQEVRRYLGAKATGGAHRTHVIQSLKSKKAAVANKQRRAPFQKNKSR